MTTEDGPVKQKLCVKSCYC